MQSPIDLAIEAVRQSHNDGYSRGVMAALTEMRFLACVVPASVTKQWILDEITRRADELEITIRQPEVSATEVNSIDSHGINHA